MDIDDLTQAMHQFVSDKGWYQPESLRPQTPKNLAVSLSIEAAEVLELFQWREDPPDPDMLAGELADVTLYLLQLASVSGIDLKRAVLEKLQINKSRQWESPENKQNEEKTDEN
jgi:NTP pyrophosphatase (non-canonical NTP hydrolase)